MTVMFWKLLLVILSLGATASGLLVMRQQRLDLLAAQTAVKEDLIGQEHALRGLRLDVERALTREELQRWIDRSGIEFHSIPFEIEFQNEFDLSGEMGRQQASAAEEMDLGG